MTNIHGINIDGLGLRQLGGVQKKDDASPVPNVDSGSKPADTVALSAKAKAVDRLSGLLESSRSDRLLQIKAMLDAGTYSPAGDAIALKMIRLNSK
jgi:hypothetical protein